MPAKKVAKKAAKSGSRKVSQGLTAGEKAALRETLLERRGETEGEGVVLERIAAMPPADRAIAQRIHAIVRANAPHLTPKTWYGMPAYANEAGKVVCFFKDAAKFKSRYATFGFEDAANLDDDAMWPTSYAITKLTAADEAKIAAIVKKAAR